MVEQAALDGAAGVHAAAVPDGTAQAASGLSSRSRRTAIDIYRRNLHRSYLDTVDNRLNGTTEPSDEVRALLRGELRALDDEIEAALTRRHRRSDETSSSGRAR